MTKVQIWNEVESQVMKLLETQPKMSKAFKEELMTTLEANLKPKSSAGSAMNPQKLDDDGVVIEAYCRFHKRYEVAEDMVMSKGKSKGYCKASISLWNKTNSSIKKLDASAVDAMSNDDFDNAKTLAQESKELKATFNTPEFYDYDRDWLTFRK